MAKSCLLKSYLSLLVASSLLLSCSVPQSIDNETVNSSNNGNNEIISKDKNKPEAIIVSDDVADCGHMTVIFERHAQCGCKQIIDASQQ